MTCNYFSERDLIEQRGHAKVTTRKNTERAEPLAALNP
jgi:hypothetical protein